MAREGIEGAVCALHGEPAVASCERCGSYVCGAEAVQRGDAVRCTACTDVDETPPARVHPLLSIWYAPGGAFSRLRHRPATGLAWILVVIGGAGTSASSLAAWLATSGEAYGLPMVGLHVLHGVGLGILAMLMQAAAAWGAGRWVDGTASPRECRTVVGWSFYPLALVAPLLLLLALTGAEAGPPAAARLLLSTLLFILPAAAVSTWLQVAGMKEMHRFGWPAAILVTLLSWIPPSLLSLFSSWLLLGLSERVANRSVVY